MEKNKDGEYWVCIIGPVERKELLEDGADGPPRDAAIEAIEKMIGRDVERCSSGWGCSKETRKKILRIWLCDNIFGI